MNARDRIYCFDVLTQRDGAFVIGLPEATQTVLRDPVVQRLLDTAFESFADANKAAKRVFKNAVIR